MVPVSGNCEYVGTTDNRRKPVVPPSGIQTASLNMGEGQNHLREGEYIIMMV
jgi:hypothetical protein